MTDPARVAGRIGHWLLVAALIAGGLIMIFPLFWLFSTSFRSVADAYKMPPSFQIGRAHV